MPLQIVNPTVVGKVEHLSKVTGLSTTAVVERAIDQLFDDLKVDRPYAAQVRALLAQIDRIPDRADATDPLHWDEKGLPQ